MNTVNTSTSDNSNIKPINYQNLHKPVSLYITQHQYDEYNDDLQWMTHYPVSQAER